MPICPVETTRLPFASPEPHASFWNGLPVDSARNLSGRFVRSHRGQQAIVTLTHVLKQQIDQRKNEEVVHTIVQNQPGTGNHSTTGSATRSVGETAPIRHPGMRKASKGVASGSGADSLSGMDKRSGFPQMLKKRGLLLINKRQRRST